MKSEFNRSVFWKDQKFVTLYHGSSVRRLSSIEESGLLPGCDGRIYLTTSPSQAQSYAHMDGENRYLNDPDWMKVETKDIIVFEVKVNPNELKLNGGGCFNDRDKFNKLIDLIEEYFGDNPDRLQLEFSTTSRISPQKITRLEGCNE